MIRQILCMCCICISGAFLMSCVEDPPVPVSGEAVLRSTFIPQDSINQLSAQQSLNQELINMASDSLDYIDSLVNAGDPTDYTQAIENLNSDLDSLQTVKSTLSSSINLLSRGSILIDFLTAEGSAEEITYENARTVYGLPLNSTANQTNFMIGYGSYSPELSVEYQIETLFDERVVRRRGYDLTLSASTFDSVKIKCPSDTCTTDEILYTFYF